MGTDETRRPLSHFHPNSVRTHVHLTLLAPKFLILAIRYTLSKPFVNHYLHIHRMESRIHHFDQTTRFHACATYGRTYAHIEHTWLLWAWDVLIRLQWMYQLASSSKIDHVNTSRRYWAYCRAYSLQQSQRYRCTYHSKSLAISHPNLHLSFWRAGSH